jgi:hypothetical protein
MVRSPGTTERSVATAIVERIAAAEGIDPLDLEVPLYDVIDPDALEALTNASDDGDARADLELTFSYSGYIVTVDGRGNVEID